MTTLPENLDTLHSQEEQLRAKALELVAQDAKLGFHLAVTEQAMNVCDVLRQFRTEDENLKVIQMLGMRMFNAFGASLKLALSGCIQNSALVLRDIEKTSLDAVFSEMGRLAVQAGQHLVAFYPEVWEAGKKPRTSFAEATRNWFLTFYPGAFKP